MEAMVKKYQHKFSKVREEMALWEELQSRFISQIGNACSIIERLQLIGDKKYYGSLKAVDGIEETVLRKQMESLESILLSINKTMEDFYGILLSIEKMLRDCKQLVKGGPRPLSVKQLQQRIGVKPSVSDCIDGLAILHEMHNTEYLLKTSVVSALMTASLKSRATDLGALRQLLVDQPNIPKDEVEFIFDIIFSEDIC